MWRSMWQVSKPWLVAGAAALMVMGLLNVSPGRSVAAEPIEPRADSAAWPGATSAFTIGLKLISGGLIDPVHLTHAGDDSGRLFVIEQAGLVRVIKNGALLVAPYLDINTLVLCCGEQGLLSIAFDPDFKTNGTFYLNYTDNSGDTTIVRYVASNPAADVFSGASAIILTIDQPESNHNGGQLQFGPNDGYLYIGMGDGGGGGDDHGPIGNGQNPAQLLGKLLRINVRGVPTYTIPATNPFTQTAGYRPEIWALGLRNPWRFSFDRANGDLFLGDVGQNCWEEIDYQPGSSAGGQNYGWRQMEGLRPFNVSNFDDCLQAPITPAGLTLPVAVYDRSLGTAVSGGYVYRGQQYPQLSGVYFYADYSFGNIWSLEQLSPGVWSSDLKLNAGFNVSSFGEDQSGELYVTGRNTGQVYQIISAPYTPPADLSTSIKRASLVNVDQGDAVTYTIVLRNTGGPATARITDTLPGGLSYVPGSFTATLGTVQAAPPLLTWSGVISTTPAVTLLYVTTVTVAGPIGLTNSVAIDSGLGAPFTRTSTIIVNGVQLYLPLIVKMF